MEINRNNSLIYVPYNHINEFACYYVYNGSTIRAYKQPPSHNTTVYYTDFHINSHYLETNGVQSFSSYSTLPICNDKSKITNDIFYRNDFFEIIGTFLCIVIFVSWFPIKLFNVFRKRSRLWKKF